MLWIERWINRKVKRESMMKYCVCLTVCIAEQEGKREKQTGAVCN